jgi:hypothetical protein
MSVSQCGTPLRGSGDNLTVWKLEWTYSSTGGEVTLDTAQSDQSLLVTTPVADSGTTGLTSIVFPKSTRAWVLHASLEVVTADISDPTDYRMTNVLALSATAGTCQMAFSEIETAGALADPNTGARARLILLLERA